MRRLRWILLLLFVVLFASWLPRQSAAAQDQESPYIVQPGDTWPALAIRFGLEGPALQAEQGSINRTRHPAIGSVLSLEGTPESPAGALLRVYAGGLLQTAVGTAQAPWDIALSNELVSPYRPLVGRNLTLPAAPGQAKELPNGIGDLDLSSFPLQPGEAVAISFSMPAPGQNIQIELAGQPMATSMVNDQLIALGATGAFQPAGPAELRILIDGQPAWSQPVLFVDKDWIFQDLTLTGEAAAIDQASIEAERERLSALWTQNSSLPQWTGPFMEPIEDYLEKSAPFGARRSYNGGPYRSYHEGTDYSAYAGTPVYAAAAGTVALAEPLFVRGGAVIIDHGAALFTGYYHLSAVHVAAGQAVTQGQLIGEVGTTGLSTGNHLHWDVLANGIWVDSAAFLESGLACWISTRLQMPCQ